VRHVVLAVLVALIVTVGTVAPVVAGASSSGGVYQISGMDVPASVTTDESFTVSATLSNSGSIDMQVVAFRIDTNGDGEFTPNESLGAEAFVLLEGASRNVTFDVAVPEDLAPGEYEYMLYTESGTETGTITVESPMAPATFLLSDVSGPESVTSGDSFAVETSVANVGDLNGSETLSLYLDTDGDGNLTDEAALANTTFELASASNGSVALSATAPDVTPGQYTYAVGTSTEMLTGTMNITEPPAPFDVVSLRGSRTMVGGSLSVSTIVENTGEKERTGTVDLRLDTNGDGEFSASETVRTRELSLGIGASQQHGFSVALGNEYDPGTYEVALVTPSTEQVTSFTVYMPDRDDEEKSAVENPQKPYRGEPWQLPGIIQLEDYDLGGEGVAYHEVGVVAEENAGGEYRVNESVDIEDLNDAPDDYTVGYTNDGEWLEYTADVEPGTYDIVIPVASNRAPNDGGPRNVTVLFEGERLGAVDVPVTGGWDKYETRTIEDVEISGGEGVVRVELGGKFIILDYIEFQKQSEAAE
jgi:hypothetical protein